MTEQDTGNPYDHPIIEKLDMIDQIVLKAHIAATVAVTDMNARVEVVLGISNFLNAVVVAENTEFTSEQKNTLVAFQNFLLIQMQKTIEKRRETMGENL